MSKNRIFIGDYTTACHCGFWNPGGTLKVWMTLKRLSLRAIAWQSHRQVLCVMKVSLLIAAGAYYFFLEKN
jgi:hypothetical protein